MSGPDEEPTESPATWENIVAGKAKEVLGRATRDPEMTEEGEEQVEVAHEVREERDQQREA